MNIIDKINNESLNDKIPNFRPGDTVRVHQVIQEGGKQRIQIFEGLVIRRKGGKRNESFTVRKLSHGIGVERIYPLNSPMVSKIEVKQRGQVRRAKLYYLRGLQGKAAKIEEARYEAEKQTPAQKEPVAESPKKEPKKTTAPLEPTQEAAV